ncbi:MAG: RHS repeat domain-containing protein [Terriglobales bacterium]
MRAPVRLAALAAVAAVACLLLGTPAQAQMPPQSGAPGFGYSDHWAGVSVYAANDNVTLTIPIFAKQGRGVGFDVAMVYNSTMYWNPTGTAFTTDSDTEEYGGWVVQPDFGTVDYDEHDVSARDGSGYCLYSYDENFRYYSPDGTMHSLPGAYLESDGQTTYPLPPGTCHQGRLSTTATASDGSGWTLSATASSSASATVNMTSEVMTARNGDTVNLLAAGAGQPVFEDTNGNYLSSGGSGDETDWYDTTGTNPVAKIIHLTNCVNPVNGQQYPSCVEYEVPNAAGGYATWTMYLANLSVNSGSCSGVSAYSGTMTVPMFLVMPEYTTGSKWYYQFAYGGAGRLTALDYPTGGVTSFSNSDPCTFSDGTLATVAVSTNDGQGNTGTTTYTRNNAGQTTISRPDGSKTVVTYDASGLPTDVKNYQTDGATLLSEDTYTNTGGTPDFPATETEYLNGTEVTGVQTSFDSSGDLTSEIVTDEISGAARTTTIGYFAPGKPSSITVSAGGTTYSQTNITYDNYGSPSGLVNPTTTLANHDSSYSTNFTNRSNPTEIARTVAGSTALDTYIAYDTGGNVVSTTEPNGHAVASAYNQCGGTYPSSIAVPGGNDSLANDCGTGLPLSTTGPNGHATTYTYNADGLLATITDPDSGGETISYGNGPVETEVQTDINGTTLQQTQYQVVDGYGRTIYAEAQDTTGCDIVATQYGRMGRVAAVSQPFSVAACGEKPGGSPVFTQTAYDGLGRPLTVTAANGAVTNYNFLGPGPAVTVTGPAPGSVTHILQTNGFGELAAVCEVTSLPGSSNCGLDASGTGYLTTYGYNPLGKLTGVNEDGQTRSFTYDELGRMTSETTPESGTTTFIYDTGDSSCGNYAAAGSLVERKDNMATVDVTCYEYDPFDRVTQITYPSGQYASVTPTKTFVYDGATVDGQAMSNAAGRLAEAYTVASGSKITDEGFGYDTMGRPAVFFEMAPGSNGYYETTESYWQNGQADQLTVPGVPKITYNPNVAGEVASVDAASGQNPVSSTTYNANGAIGQLTGINYGSGDSDSFSYDLSMRWMTGYAFDINGQTETGQLGWNADGTLGSLDISDPFDAGDTQNCTFTQDDLGRLSGVNCGSEWSQTFKTDAYGDVAVTTGNNVFPASFSNNQISDVNGFTPNYDADGNLLDNPVTQAQNVYGWDADGRPVEVDGVSQTFDALGRPVYNTNGPAQFVWTPDGDKIAVMGGQSLGFALIPLPGGAVALYYSSGLGYYAHPDWEGSWRLDSSPSRTETGDQAYAPYGATYAGSGPVAFTGHWQYTPDNLDDAPYRLLAPTMGRWLSPDPAGVAAVNPANPQTWNAYAYVGNTPLRATDPLGLMDPPDPSALYAESWFDVWQATGGFEGGENEFQLQAIPVRYFGAQADPVFYFTDVSSNFLGTVNEAVRIYWSTDPSIIGNGAELFGGPDPAGVGPVLGFTGGPRPAPMPSMAAVIHKAYSRWRGCTLGSMGTNFASEMVSGAFSGQSPKLVEDTTGAWLKAASGCLARHPLAGLDGSYNGPPPGDVFVPPPFPLSLYWPDHP